MTDLAGPSNSFLIPICSRSIIPFMSEVRDNLNSRGHSLQFIPQNKYIGEESLKYLPKNDLNIGYLTHSIETDLDSLCSKYDISSIRRQIFPQMVYERQYPLPSRLLQSDSFSGEKFTQYRDKFHRILDYCDSLYVSNEGIVPLQFQGGEILRRVVQIVADYHDCPSVRTSFSPVPNSVSFRTSESKRWKPFEKIQYDKMTDEERKQAKQLRNSVVNDQTLLETDGANEESLAENLRRKANRIQQYGTDSIPVIIDWLRRNGAKPLVGNVTERLYMNKKDSREFINSKDYIFYPIQYFRESRVTMRSPAFYDQVWLIEYLSRSLPPGYELVVKDHPQQLGALPLSNVRTIKRYATAVAPDIPAREVVKEADAVVTLNNTVGYEAVMHGKSVLTLGDAFYNGSKYTQNISDINRIHMKMHNAAESTGLSEQEVLEFSSGIIESSYEGVWGDIDPENIEQFVDSMLEFLTDIEP